MGSALTSLWAILPPERGCAAATVRAQHNEIAVVGSG